MTTSKKFPVAAINIVQYGELGWSVLDERSRNSFIFKKKGPTKMMTGPFLNKHASLSELFTYARFPSSFRL